MTSRNRMVPRTDQPAGAREVNPAGKITSAHEGRKAGSKVPPAKKKAKNRRKKK